jgi:hypothetical protein
LLSLISPELLKPAGSDRYKCRCFFHAEDTPSMVVNKRGGVWRFHCFGCGADGNVVSFVMLRERCDFNAAMAILKAGVVNMGEPPPKPKPRWLAACEGRGCGRTLGIFAVTALAYVHQKGWRLDGDKTWCGWCLEKARRIA